MQLLRTLLGFLLLLGCASLPAASAHGQPPGGPRRVAVIVGANAAAPGRRALRYSQRDAQNVGRVLRELGGFSEGDVSVLLDPDPSVVLAALDQQLARVRGAAEETVLIFYYSGHADAGALYPRGRALPLSDLRTRLSDPRAGVRIGIIDACRGGGWTGAKGLGEIEPFPVDLPTALQSQGSVLIASSSGQEDAHESEQLAGSFFTHHWIGALRGAGDRNRDNQVSLNEAFDYARELTIRDTALHTASPQHPSFSMQLHGRSDLLLSSLVAASAVLSVEQQQGPLELVHLGSGVVLLEVPQGQRSVRLAVMPGRYVLRRRTAEKLWAKEIAIKAGERLSVNEAGLTLIGSGQLAAKYSAPRPLTLSSLPDGKQELTIGLGVSYGNAQGLSVGAERSFSVTLSAPHAFSDRFQWLLPSLAFSYRFGEHGGLEWLPWAGFPRWGLGYSSVEGMIFVADPGLGVDLRYWFTPRSSIELGAGFISRLGVHSKRESLAQQKERWNLPEDLSEEDADRLAAARSQRRHWSGPTSWRARLTLGVTYTIAEVVTLHLGLLLGRNVIDDGGVPRANDLVFGIGSVQTLGLRSLPLLRIHLSDRFALNADVAVIHHFLSHRTYESYMAGGSVVW